MTPTQPEVAQGNPRAWMTVAQREISLKVRDKSFVISIAFTVVCILGALGASLVMGDRQPTVTVATADAESGRLLQQAQRVADRGGSNVSLVERRTPDPAAAVRAGEADLALAPTASGTQLLGPEVASSPGTEPLQQAYAAAQFERNAQRVGVDASQITAGSTLPLQSLDDGRLSDGAIRIAAIGLAFGFYLCALMFGAMVAQSVLEEKQNRIVEIVASLIPLRSLLVGKIIGSAVVAFIQVGVMVLALVVVLSVRGVPVDVGQLGLTGLWFVVFFVVGYLAVAALWAMAGALATRQEDMQHTATPVSIVLVVVIPVGLFLSGTWLQVASYVPIANVVAMPIRVLSGDAAWWEPVISLVILGAFSLGVADFAARVYRRSLLQTNRRLTVREALRIAD